MTTHDRTDRVVGIALTVPVAAVLWAFLSVDAVGRRRPRPRRRTFVDGVERCRSHI